MRVATVQNIIVKYLTQMIGILVQRKEKSLWAGRKLSWRRKGSRMNILGVFALWWYMFPWQWQEIFKICLTYFHRWSGKGFPSWHPVTSDRPWGLNLHVVPSQRGSRKLNLAGDSTECTISQSHTIVSNMLYCFLMLEFKPRTTISIWF